jgi:hypothetical protein
VSCGPTGDRSALAADAAQRGFRDRLATLMVSP